MVHEFAAKQHILNIAHTPQEAIETVIYLSSLDWTEIFAEKERREKTYEEQEKIRVEQILLNGGGYCQNCRELSEQLYVFDHTVNRMGLNVVLATYEINEKLCYRCLVNMEKQWDIDSDICHRNCDECHKVVTIKELGHHPFVGTRYYGHCQECLNKFNQRHTITCSICGVQNFQDRISDTCDECEETYPYQKIINIHLNRARKVNLPATLTLPQWVKTLEHFNYHCAYCAKRAYRDLEHYLPIGLGGGTTAGNCLPSCSKCNLRKSDRHPDDFTELFSAENLARIQAYSTRLANEGVKQSE